MVQLGKQEKKLTVEQKGFPNNPNILYTLHAEILGMPFIFICMHACKTHALYLSRIKLLDNQICVYLSHVSTQTYGCSNTYKFSNRS